jgi:outer membrane protein assembly factor BamB
MANLTRVFRGVTLLLFSTVIVGCASFDGDEELEPAELIDFEAERTFKKVWSNSVGDGQGGIFNRLTPAFDGDMIYGASAEGEIEAMSREKGKTRWDADVETLLVGGVGVGDNIILLGSAAGEVIALDKNNGEPLWKVEVGGEVLAAPKSNGELVFVQTFDGQIIALKSNNGERVWSYRNTLPILTLRGTSTPLLIRDSVIAAFANGRVISFDMKTGAVKWNTRVALAKGDSEIERIIDIDGTLLEDSGVIYAASYQGKVAAIEASSGRRLWSNDASSYVGISQGFGNIYVVGEDGSVTAFEKNGQGSRWAQTILARRKLSGSATLNSYVIVADFEGYMHALSQVDGHIAARTRVDSDGVQTDLQVVGDLLFAYGNSGKLSAYRLVEKSKGFF